MDAENVAIIGAGPAGLAAAYELVRHGIQPTVLERAGKVGGIARTETYKGYHFDIGGHRFLTKMGRIGRLWREMLGDDFLRVPRLSRIYYQGRFFNYPLQLFNAMNNLGLIESLLILASYLEAQVFPYSEEETFEQWVSNRFGRRLYQTFFKTYTEKVWGIPCHKIQADWAAQRIKGLSLIVALSNALLGIRQAKSLVSEFHYPLRGPGMMWQRFQEAIVEGGGKIHLDSELVRLQRENDRITSLSYTQGGEITEIPVGYAISSIPVNRLVALLQPGVPDRVLEASRNLSHRAFLIVGLIVDREDLFPDQWIYVHSPDVRVGRIQNFKNWSAAMVPDPGKTSVGMEYFCNEGDETWSISDDALIDLASRELSQLGLVERDEIIDGFVVRQPDAYPIYDPGYRDRLRVIRDFLGNIVNIQTVGRSGMHRYNNMDHSMYTGILAAENALGAKHNLWEVNEEGEYLEEDKEAQVLPETILRRTFARMDKVAFATALGAVLGLLIFLVTIWPVVWGDEILRPTLWLFAQYFVGYTVTVKGAFVALGYTFFWGFLFGWLLAYLRNLSIGFYIYRVKRKAEGLLLRDFLDVL